MTVELPPETVEAVAVFVLRARRLVEGVLGGLHRSPFEGASIEFSSYKDYTPGDDLRHIDWKAYGRTDRIYLKRHMRETAASGYLVMDRTRSMTYRGERALFPKMEYASLLAAAFAMIMLRQGDAPGLLCFSRSKRFYLPPRRRPDHLQAVLDRLALPDPDDVEGDEAAAHPLPKALEELAAVVKGRSMIFIFSDLLDLDPEALSSVRLLGARGHDVSVVQVLDPDEADLGFRNASLFVGLEGEGELTADPSLVRRAYLAGLERLENDWRKTCGESGCEFARVESGRPLEEALSRLLAGRSGRGGR